MGRPDLDQLKDFRRKFSSAWIIAVAERVDAADAAFLLEAGADDISSAHPAELMRRLEVWRAGLRSLPAPTGREEERRVLERERKAFERQRLDSLSVMAGGIAHDFNNLLTVIIGNAGMAAALVPPDSPAQTLLANAEKTCMQAAELCKQMLAYAGRGKIVARDVRLDNLLAETDPLLRMSIGKEIDLVIDSPGAGIPLIKGEPSQLQQVMVNLVLNASEAIGAAPGTVCVSISARHLDVDWFEDAHGQSEVRSGPFVVLEVSDTGAGMAPETKARIFDPFFSTKFTGRGLGLASVLGMVRRHGGAIRFQSERGKGSVFQVALPAAVPPGPPARSASSLPATDTNGLVLVIDDEEPVRRVTEAILRHGRYEVVAAADGPEGLRLFRATKDRLCAVLLDLTMPVMDGAKVLAHIRQLSPEMPVLLMSGFSDAEIGEKYAEEPPTSFLAKPFSRERLHEELEDLLMRQRLDCP